MATTDDKILSVLIIESEQLGGRREEGGWRGEELEVIVLVFPAIVSMITSMTNSENTNLERPIRQNWLISHVLQKNSLTRYVHEL